jgi:NADH-quinone oxidoreductase subunit K
MSPLHLCLALSAALFCAGLVAVLIRGNAILVLLGVELMLNAANLNFLAFWRFGPGGGDAGLVFVLFSIAVAAAEAAVGMALVIAVHRHLRSTRLAEANRLKG